MPTDVAVSFRSLAREDFPNIQRWLRTQHVGRWWRDPSDLDSIEAHYGPCIDRTDPTRVYIIGLDARDIGLIQSYRWVSSPAQAEALGIDVNDAGLDFFVGEADLVGRGLGSEILRAFIGQLLFADWTIGGVTVEPEVENTASLRAFEKAGFKPIARKRLADETSDRQVMRLARG